MVSTIDVDRGAAKGLFIHCRRTGHSGNFLRSFHLDPCRVPFRVPFQTFLSTLLEICDYDLQLRQEVVDLEREVRKDADSDNVLNNVEGRAQSRALEAVGAK
jgi:hypothetical protein